MIGSFGIGMGSAKGNVRYQEQGKEKEIWGWKKEKTLPQKSLKHFMTHYSGIPCGTVAMAQEVRVPADLSLIPGTHTMEVIL